ncbi:MAG: FAD-binding protein [Nitrososphaeria archaeon]|nr:FAD-binding protein [Nitrososphaeria archaeon]
MTFPNSLILELENIVGKDYVLSKKEQIEPYLYDETFVASSIKPSTNCIVVKPISTEQVSKIVKLANEKRIPIYPRGGGTGVVAAAVPTKDGIIISLERMKNVIIDKDNMMALVEPGVTLEEFGRIVTSAGFIFPPYPANEQASMGAITVNNSGGARAVKHGVMRHHVKGLEVVLPTGEILNLGGKLIKDNVTSSLIQLIVGSGGILGIVTKTTVKLLPKPEYQLTLLVPFNNRHDAFSAVAPILSSGIEPLSLEYVENKCMDISAKDLGETWYTDIPGPVLLLIQLAGKKDIVFSEAEKASDFCLEHNSLEPRIAEGSEENRVWKIRKNVLAALKPLSSDVLDVTVPPAQMGKLADELDRIASKYNTEIPAYGHAGDGNIHPHILRKDLENCEKIRNEIYEATLNLGGVITGEHGVGKARVKEFYKYVDPKVIELLSGIKKLFDPNNILNPTTMLG